MRRQLTVLALAGIIGTLMLSSDASACHKKRCAAPTACVVAAPAPCVVAAPAPCPPPVACAPKKHCFSGFKLPKFKGFGCHKQQAVCATPVVYESAPVYAAPQAIPSAQTLPSGQGY